MIVHFLTTEMKIVKGDPVHPLSTSRTMYKKHKKVANKPLA